MIHRKKVYCAYPCRPLSSWLWVYKHVLGARLTTRRQITKISTILTEGGAKPNYNEDAELAAAAAAAASL